jgi:hypothetical protein
MTISNIFKNSPRYLQVKMHQRYWYLYAKSTNQRYPKEKMKNFLIVDLFHLPLMSTTSVVVHLELRISPRIFEKIRNGPNGIIRGLVEIDPCRKPEVKNLVALSL